MGVFSGNIKGKAVRGHRAVTGNEKEAQDRGLLSASEGGSSFKCLRLLVVRDPQPCHTPCPMHTQGLPFPLSPAGPACDCSPCTFTYVDADVGIDLIINK